MPKIITRRAGETIQLGRDIQITVNKVGGKRCTLKIEAPQDLEIMRLDGDQLRPAPLPPIDWNVIRHALKDAIDLTVDYDAPDTCSLYQQQLEAVEARLSQKRLQTKPVPEAVGLEDELRLIDAGD